MSANRPGSTSGTAARAAWDPGIFRHFRIGPSIRQTLTAVRKNPWLRCHYQRLRARGKLPKVALIACMHKLLLAIYSVAKHRRPFTTEVAA